MKTIDDYSDERLLRLPFLLSKTQVYKIRKGLMTTADVPGLDRLIRRMDDSHLMVDQEPEVNMPGPMPYA